MGKGTQIKNLNIIKVSISKDTLEEILEGHLVGFEGNEFLVFEVVALKKADRFGKTILFISAKSWPSQKKGAQKMNDLILLKAPNGAYFMVGSLMGSNYLAQNAKFPQDPFKFYFSFFLKYWTGIQRELLIY